MAPFAIHVEFINYQINGAALSNDDWPALYRRHLNIRWKVHISMRVRSIDIYDRSVRYIWRFKIDLIWWCWDRYAARYTSEIVGWRAHKTVCMSRHQGNSPAASMNDMINVPLRVSKDFSDASACNWYTGMLWVIRAMELLPYFENFSRLYERKKNSM